MPGARPRKTGDIVRELRERGGMSLDALAEKAQVARSFLVLIEAGHDVHTSRAILQRLARALNVPVQRLADAE